MLALSLTSCMTVDKRLTLQAVVSSFVQTPHSCCEDDIRKCMEVFAGNLVHTTWSTNRWLLSLIGLDQLCPFSRGRSQGYSSAGVLGGDFRLLPIQEGLTVFLFVRDPGWLSQHEEIALTDRMKALPALAHQ